MLRKAKVLRVLREVKRMRLVDGLICPPILATIVEYANTRNPRHFETVLKAAGETVYERVSSILYTLRSTIIVSDTLTVQNMVRHSLRLFIIFYPAFMRDGLRDQVRSHVEPLSRGGRCGRSSSLFPRARCPLDDRRVVLGGESGVERRFL